MQKFYVSLASSLLALAMITNAQAIEITEESTGQVVTPRTIDEQVTAQAPAPEAKKENTTTANNGNTANQPAPTTVASANTAPEKSEASAADASTENRPKSKFTVYVSDNMDLYATRGPGREYRIAGTVKTGEKLDVLNEQNGYYQVYTSKGKTLWIPKKDTQTEISYRERVISLERENEILKYKLANIDSETARELKSASMELTTLKKAHEELKTLQSSQEAKLNELTETNEDLESRLETKDQDMQIRWWKQGAFIALIGALVAVILVYLPRPRRKNNDYYY